MKSIPSCLAVLTFLTAVASSAAAAPQDASSRTYDLRWHVQVDSIPSGAHEARIWVALPQERPEQRILDLTIRAPFKHSFVKDAVFGNRVAMFTVKDPPPSLAIDLSATVKREAVGPRHAKITQAERQLYLRKEALVSLSPRIHALADSVGGTPHDRYEFVLGRMDYDKTVPGWGRGDSERACDVGKGNCTDFHSLFLSLSRAEGVPSVFEMGYSMLPEGEKEHAGGYHCWAWFYDDANASWVSRGRDVVLPGMKGSPLNYLPSSAYVEIDGVPRETGVTRTITYPAPTAEAAGQGGGSGTSGP